MIILIHGADTASSRKFFTQAMKNCQNPAFIDGTTATIAEISQILNSNGLFYESKEIFIEGLLRKKQKETAGEIAEILLKNSASSGHTVYLWEAKELEKRIQMQFKNATIREFKLPQSLFQFLDNLKPGNTKMLLPLFHAVLSSTEEEVVFYMIVRQFRILLALSSPSTDKIDEVKRLADWQKTKLRSQLDWFGKDQILNIYNSLFALEEANKTGKMDMPLSLTIDFFLLKL
jgi:hypothetical protein